MEHNVVRLIDDLGRIVLPHEVRQAMGWEKKTPVEIQLNIANNEVILKRSQFTCVFCGATENLVKHESQFICQNCKEEIGKL